MVFFNLASSARCSGPDAVSKIIEWSLTSNQRRTFHSFSGEFAAYPAPAGIMLLIARVDLVLMDAIVERRHITRALKINSFLFLGFLFAIIGSLFALAHSRQMMRAISGDEPHLLHHDGAGWHRYELPGIPYEIQMASANDVWVETHSPDGLSHWSSGQWMHYGTAYNPSGGFAVAGDQAWVSNSHGIQRFDGHAWGPLPVDIPDPVATAANGNEVWVINSHGMLAHCAASVCDTHSLADQIYYNDLKSGFLGRRSRYERKFGARSLAWAQHRLWFIDKGAWYSSDGRHWTEWQSSNSRVWPGGVSGGRLWFWTVDYMFALGDDLVPTSFSLYPLRFPSLVEAGDGHVRVASNYVLFQYSNGHWDPISFDPQLHAEQVSSFAVAPNGNMWLVAAKRPNPMGAADISIPFAVIIGWGYLLMRQASRNVPVAGSARLMRF